MPHKPEEHVDVSEHEEYEDHIHDVQEPVVVTYDIRVKNRLFVSHDAVDLGAVRDPPMRVEPLRKKL